LGRLKFASSRFVTHLDTQNYRGLAALRRTCGIPIAAGENVHTLMDFARLMKAGAVNFVEPGPAKAGGVSELCEVYSIAAVHNVAVVPHSFYDGPGLLAAIHTTVGLGTAETMIEWRVFDLEAQLYAGSDVADPTNFSTVMPNHSRPDRLPGGRERNSL
jgi:L-alanine-DL-glutamate epimerase-like enolase superfamily enzyme